MNNAQRQIDYWTFRYCLILTLILLLFCFNPIDLLYKLVYTLVLTGTDKWKTKILEFWTKVTKINIKSGYFFLGGGGYFKKGGYFRVFIVTVEKSGYFWRAITLGGRLLSRFYGINSDYDFWL